MEVELAQRRPEPVGIVDLELGAARVPDPQAVHRDLGARQLGDEHPGLVHLLHGLLGAVVEEEGHGDGVGPPAPHDHVAVGDVRAEQVVGVDVVAGNQVVDLALDRVGAASLPPGSCHSDLAPFQQPADGRQGNPYPIGSV